LSQTAVGAATFSCTAKKKSGENQPAFVQHSSSKTYPNPTTFDGNFSSKTDADLSRSTPNLSSTYSRRSRCAPEERNSLPLDTKAEGVTPEPPTLYSKRSHSAPEDRKSLSVNLRGGANLNAWDNFSSTPKAKDCPNVASFLASPVLIVPTTSDNAEENDNTKTFSQTAPPETPPKPRARKRKKKLENDETTNFFHATSEEKLAFQSGSASSTALPLQGDAQNGSASFNERPLQSNSQNGSTSLTDRLSQGDSQFFLTPGSEAGANSRGSFQNVMGLQESVNQDVQDVDEKISNARLSSSVVVSRVVEHFASCELVNSSTVPHRRNILRELLEYRDASKSWEFRDVSTSCEFRDVSKSLSPSQPGVRGERFINGCLESGGISNGTEEDVEDLEVSC
jgi:hypothetical protein